MTGRGEKGPGQLDRKGQRGGKGTERGEMNRERGKGTGRGDMDRERGKGQGEGKGTE